MGNRSSLTKGGIGKGRNELLLDDIIDEVQNVSGLLLAIVQSIKEHKQLGKATDNDATNYLLEGLLRGALEKLQFFFTIDVYTTCQERNDNGATLFETLNSTEKGSQLLTKAGLSDADIKNVYQKVKDLKNRSIVNIEHLGEQLERFSASQSKSFSSQKQYLRENRKTECCDQQQPHSDREKVHEEKNHHSFRKVTIKPTPNDHIERLHVEEQLLKHKNEALQIENEEFKTKQIQEINSNSANEVAKQNTDIETKQREILNLKEENKQLLLRLSKLAGEKLTKDNPNITDLSDANRPTKLGEIYSELYDNEWTDAYEGLSNAGYQETEAIRVLSITLKNSYKFCAKNATDMLKKTEDVAMQLFAECKKSQSVCQSVAIPKTETKDESGQASHSALEEHFIERHWKPKQRTASVTGGKRASNTQMEVVKPTKMEDELVKLLKEVSLSMVPVVQQAYLRGKWDETCIEPLKPFIKKCLFLCWMMVVQSPPMVFDKNTAEGTRFDSALYKQYTKTGDVLEYVVWPALLLLEDGPIVCKGVAQPKKAKK